MGEGQRAMGKAGKEVKSLVHSENYVQIMMIMCFLNLQLLTFN